MTDMDALVSDEDIPSLVVAALYQALLGREPDPTGQTDKVARLREGVSSPREIADEMVQSAEFGNRLADIAARAASTGRLRFTNDQSQYGEVGLLLRLWVNGQAKSQRRRILAQCGACAKLGSAGRRNRGGCASA